jgi:hypothetical protein
MARVRRKSRATGKAASPSKRAPRATKLNSRAVLPQVATKARRAPAATLKARSRAVVVPERVVLANGDVRVSQTFAAASLFELCAEAVNDGEKRVYVRNSRNRSFLTLDPRPPYLQEPVVPVSMQFFKDNFARFSSVVKNGVCFKLTRRGGAEPIYARRHTRYRDPLDDVLDQWREKLIAMALREMRSEMKRMAGVISKHDGEIETLEANVERLFKGVMRVAIGHRPFDEGQLSGSASDAPDSEPD